jgi:hypothetical protein
VCLNISTVKNIKLLTNSNQQTQSYKFTSHIAAFLSVALITEMLEICKQTSYDQNIQLILKRYLPVVYGTTLSDYCLAQNHGKNKLHLDKIWPQMRLVPYNETNIHLKKMKRVKM